MDFQVTIVLTRQLNGAVVRHPVLLCRSHASLAREFPWPGPIGRPVDAGFPWQLLGDAALPSELTLPVGRPASHPCSHSSHSPCRLSGAPELYLIPKHLIRVCSASSGGVWPWLRGCALRSQGQWAGEETGRAVMSLTAGPLVDTIRVPMQCRATRDSSEF